MVFASTGWPVGRCLPLSAWFAQRRARWHIVVGFKTVHILARNMPLDNLFYRIQLLDLIRADQRIGVARGTRAPGPTDAVHIIFWNIR